MALLYISEFTEIFETANGVIGFARQPSITDQSPISTAGGSVQSAAFNAATRFVRLHCDSTSACSIAFGTNPTATTSNARLAANQTEYYAVVGGQKVATINNT